LEFKAQLMRTLSSPYGPIELFPCGDPRLLERLEMDQSLNVFRAPSRQFEALVSIAKDVAGCVCFARLAHRLIGYATFHPPDSFERWHNSSVPGLLELGAVETSKTHRGRHLARHLLEVAFATGRFEDKVVIATIYHWHFDLEGTGLTTYAYRELLKRLYSSVGMSVYATNDPELDYPGNFLMARIGARATPELKAEFDRLRLL
jgi:acetoin utilization protein AcuA